MTGRGKAKHPSKMDLINEVCLLRDKMTYYEDKVSDYEVKIGELTQRVKTLEGGLEDQGRMWSRCREQNKKLVDLVVTLAEGSDEEQSKARDTVEFLQTMAGAFA